MALPFKPQSLDPGKNGNGGQNIVHWLGYEPLIHMNADGSFSPGLATEWEYIGEGNTAFEMTIRTDALFSDGTPVTAQSVADTINHYLANPGPLSHFLYGITAAAVKDDETVAIELDQPNPELPLVFSQAVNWGNVISPAGLEDPQKLTTEMFGAGPYVMNVAETVDNDRYTFDRNENYWNADAVTYDRIVVRVIPDANASLQALQTGQIQFTMNGTGQLSDQAVSGGAEVVTGQGYVNSVFLMDRSGELLPPLGDLRVRQALNYAVDREAIATALGGGYVATEQIAPEGTDAFDASLDSTYGYDPELAKELLAEAGYPDGFEMTLLTAQVTDLDTVAQAVAAQLEEVGVKVELKDVGVDINQLIADMATKEWASVTWNMGGDMFANALQNFSSPSSPLNPFASSGEEVMGPWQDLLVSSQDEKVANAKALNRAVTENAWFIPVVQTPVFFFSKGIDDVGVVGPGAVMDILDWKPAEG